MPWWKMHYWGSFDPGKFVFFPVLLPVALWSLFWKGMALYRAARNGQKGWFIALLILNTAGILEIVYLLLFSQTKHLNKGKH